MTYPSILMQYLKYPSFLCLVFFHKTNSNVANIFKIRWWNVRVVTSFTGFFKLFRWLIRNDWTDCKPDLPSSNTPLGQHWILLIIRVFNSKQTQTSGVPTKWWLEFLFSYPGCFLSEATPLASGTALCPHNPHTLPGSSSSQSLCPDIAQPPSLNENLFQIPFLWESAIYTINSVINTSVHANVLTSILSLRTCLLDYIISILPGAFQRQCLNPRRHLGEGELTLSRSLLFLKHYAKYFACYFI